MSGYSTGREIKYMEVFGAEHYCDTHFLLLLQTISAPAKAVHIMKAFPPRFVRGT